MERSPDATLTANVQAAVGQVAVARQLAQAGIGELQVPQVGVTAVNPGGDPTGERTGVAVVGMIVLYTLLILISQFVAQGVVEEKATRVVELLLSTMKPWQLLAGKVIGLGLLGLAQIVAIAVVGVAGALVFDVVSLPGQLIGTVLTVVAWFVLGYAFYASVFAAAASLVSRQEDLAAASSRRCRCCWSWVLRGTPGRIRPEQHPGEGHLLRPGTLAHGDAGAHGGRWGAGLGGRALRRPDARGHRPRGPAGRAHLRRRATAHEREDKLREALRAERV